MARMIVDFKELDNTLSIVSTGQSGQVNDAHFQDQLSLFARSYYHPNLFDMHKIRQAGWSCLMVNPEVDNE